MVVDVLDPWACEAPNAVAIVGPLGIHEIELALPESWRVSLPSELVHHNLDVFLGRMECGECPLCGTRMVTRRNWHHGDDELRDPTSFATCALCGEWLGWRLSPASDVDVALGVADVEGVPVIRLGAWLR